jgi:signal recognition particle receptor subunit beta
MKCQPDFSVAKLVATAACMVDVPGQQRNDRWKNVLLQRREVSVMRRGFTLIELLVVIAII